MHSLDLTAAMALNDERSLAIAAEAIADIIDRAGETDQVSAAVHTLLVRRAAAHPFATQRISAQLGRLAGLADLITAGLVTASPAAIAEFALNDTGQKRESRHGRKPATA